MKSLNEIGLEEDTDKAVLTHRGCHHYAELYELLFRDRRETINSLLEIGVLEGGSIRMWRKYFPNAKITAIDVNDHVTFADDPGIEFIQGDSYSDEVIMKLSDRTFDIMIDDADHQIWNQKTFLKRYSPLLAPGGILIIEDVIMKDDARALRELLPAGFDCAIVEMSEGNSIIDSRLFIAYHK